MRSEATGYGVAYFAQEMLARKSEGFEGKRVSISGSGNVAQYAAEKALEMGAKVITLSDSGGTLVHEAGLSREQVLVVMELKNVQRGRLADFAVMLI